MRVPSVPPVGSLIAFDYLWVSQVLAREEALKTYPCAVVLQRQDMGPASVAYVLGMSHAAPLSGQRAIDVPRKLKRHLGLDDAPSWLYTDQLNVFTWPGPDLRPASRLSSRPNLHDTCVIGPLPTDWFAKVVLHVEESRTLGRLRAVKRTIA